MRPNPDRTPPAAAAAAALAMMFGLTLIAAARAIDRPPIARPPIAGAAIEALPPVPFGLPPVPMPANNPLTLAKAQLGERLFFDPVLSKDRTISCASCHRPDRYFADDRALSKGVRDQDGDHNTQTALNAAYAPALLWDGRSVSLEDQVRYPVMHPKEMATTQQDVVAALAAMPDYAPLFARAFDSEAITWERMAQAIASFERTLLTGNAPFDRYVAGEQAAISDAARRGFALFSGAARCTTCHAFSKEAPFLTDFGFHNTGAGWARAPDLGRYLITKAREDKGTFRTPSLRNVAKTAPYMHDGGMQTLAEVVDFYAKGGGPNPFLDEQVRPLELSEANKADLVAFLESLTGETTYRGSPPVASVRSPFDVLLSVSHPGAAVSR